MAEGGAEFFDRVGVAVGGDRVDLGGFAARDAAGDAQAGAADQQVLAEPVMFRPGWHAREPDIGAEAAFVPAGADGGFQRVQAGLIDQADHLAAHIAEDVAGGVVQNRRAAGFIAEEGGEPGGDLRPAGGGERVGLQHGAVRGDQRHHAAALIEGGAQGCDACVAHQAHEMVLGQPRGLGGVERGIALRQRKGAVPRQSLAG